MRFKKIGIIMFGTKESDDKNVDEDYADKYAVQKATYSSYTDTEDTDSMSDLK